MRNRLNILFLLPLQLLAQVGQEAADIAIDIGTSTLQETAALVSINLSQQEILKDARDISLKSAAILAFKEAELKNMNSPAIKLQDSGQWKFTISAIDRITVLTQETIALIDSDPETYNFPVQILPTLLLKTTDLYADISQYMTADNDHLMKSTDRYELLTEANVKLAKLLKFSIDINEYVKSLAVLNKLRIDPPEFNFDTEVDRAIQQINSLIDIE